MIASQKSFNGHVFAAGEVSERKSGNLLQSDQLVVFLENSFYLFHLHLRVIVDGFAVGARQRTKASKYFLY